MKPAPFDYVRPKSLADASAALTQDGATTAAIAGGQSLLPMLNLRVAIVDLLVDIGRLDELKAVEETPDTLRIGALTTHAAIEDGRMPDLFGGLLRRIAGQISYRAVRNHGTLGGSLALADPAADWPACLLALGATVRIAGRSATRNEPVAEFLHGAFSTSLAPGEIVIGFALPRPQALLRWGFAKVARKSGAFANSIAIVTRQGRDGPASAVLGAAGPRPCRLPVVERQIETGAADDALCAAIAGDIAAAAPQADAYERRMHAATLMRAIRDMVAQ
jgi:carbon-monoxide dehydrogenase medium subunit